MIPASEVDEPLAHEPPVLVAAQWDNGHLRLTLDRAVSHAWIEALLNMGNYRSILGSEPQRCFFNGAEVTIPGKESAVQMVVDHFKSWLPIATRTLKHRLEAEMREQEALRRRQLVMEREAEERRLNVNRSLRI